MNSKLTIDNRDPFYIRKEGLAALREKLGSAGAARFIRQFSPGSGDYTKEREELLADFTFDEIVNGCKEMDARRKEQT